ncbi:MAG: DUF916 domain-containing protein [Bifidobacteriaceae bacterium]|nr:DUF916 domain-containing protein [Bifidobacteriaceae bacterium]
MQLPRTKRLFIRCAATFAAVITLAVPALVLAPAGIAAVQPGPLPATPSPEPSPLSPGQRQSERLTWGVAPSTPDGPTDRGVFEYEMNPGDGVMDYLAVANYSTKEIELDIYARDAVMTPNGGFDIQPKSETPTGAGAWFELSAKRVTIPARSRINLSFWFRVPPDAEPGDHAAGLVASLPAENKTAATTTIGLEQRVGMRFYVRVAGPLRPALSAELLDPHFDADILDVWGSVRTVLRVTNTGNVRLAGEAYLESADWLGWQTRRTTAVQVPELLPGQSLDYPMDTAAMVALGRLDLRGVVDPAPREDVGDSPPVEKKTSIMAFPWVTVSIAVLLIALLTVLIIRRRRTAKLRRQRPAPSRRTPASPTSEDGAIAKSPAEPRKAVANT